MKEKKNNGNNSYNAEREQHRQQENNAVWLNGNSIK